MTRKSGKPKKPGQVSEAKVMKTYRLSPRKIAAAQKVLGATTATATIEEALDMVVFRNELIEGTRAISGLAIDSAFPDDPLTP
jgi:hypothetical protein